jgi:hypothetical protein
VTRLAKIWSEVKPLHFPVALITFTQLTTALKKQEVLLVAIKYSLFIQFHSLLLELEKKMVASIVLATYILKLSHRQ